jgi:KaiC/GvpD/RAD55 family RecA-like ATPase
MLEALGVDNLPFGNNVVLTGPAGVGKSVFCNNLTSECLKNGINVIYATLDVAPSDVRARISTVCPEEGGLKGITFVDGYSWLIGEVHETHHVSHLSNLNDLSVRIFNAMNEQEKQPYVLVFDSISTLFVYNAENEIIRFMQVNMARVKHSNSLGFWAVLENTHSSAFCNFLRNMADGIIEMRFEEDSELKRFMRVHTLKGCIHKTNWFPFNIRERGRLTVGSS